MERARATACAAARGATPLAIRTENARFNADVNAAELEASLDFSIANKANPAPGPDGFTYADIGVFRKILMPLALDVWSSRHVTGLPKSWLSTNIKPILKDSDRDPALPSNYRPISLTSSFFKLFSRVVAGRLEPLARNTINKEQFAFLFDRDLSDAVSLVIGASSISRSLNAPLALVQVDIARAYDSLSRPYIQQALEAFGFSERFRSDIGRFFLAPSETRIVSKNRMSESFIANNGTKQGDPLSCLLYAFATAPLFFLARRLARDAGVCLGFQAAAAWTANPPIAVQQVDDILIFVSSHADMMIWDTATRIFSFASNQIFDPLKSVVRVVSNPTGSLDQRHWAALWPTAAVPPLQKNKSKLFVAFALDGLCLLYTSPSPRDRG